MGIYILCYMYFDLSVKLKDLSAADANDHIEIPPVNELQARLKN